MALPRIDESEPWLEEDEDFPSKETQKQKAAVNHFLSSLYSFTKIGAYIFLASKLFSRSSIVQDITAKALKLASHQKVIFYLFLLLLGALLSLIRKAKQIKGKRSPSAKFLV